MWKLLLAFHRLMLGGLPQEECVPSARWGPCLAIHVAALLQDFHWPPRAITEDGSLGDLTSYFWEKNPNAFIRFYQVSILFSINTNLRVKSIKSNGRILRASLIISINLKNKPANKIVLRSKMRKVSTYFIAYSVSIVYRKKKKKEKIKYQPTWSIQTVKTAGFLSQPLWKAIIFFTFTVDFLT